jgi:phage terminase small subunit
MAKKAIDNQLPLTQKMEKFAEQYVICGGNGREAARRAGYSEGTALTIATRNIRLPHVVAQINEHIAAQLPDVLTEMQRVFGQLPS